MTRLRNRLRFFVRLFILYKLFSTVEATQAALSIFF